MKQLKHYASIIAMLMLLSQITFTSCSEDFGPDIDKLKEDVSTLQNTVADLQKAYEGGKIITGVSPITTSQGGWQITFSDESTINLYNGANGSNGEDGADGVTPYMKIDTNGNWTVSYDNGETYAPITDAEGNTISSKGKDGTNGISVAVRENSEGNYEIISYLDDKENPLTVLSTPYSSNPSNQIASIVENSDQGTVVITMSSGAEYKFVQKIIYPTSIIILTDEIFVDEEEEIAEIEFRINPSNARIDKDNIIVDQIRESYLKSYASSYTNPTPNYEIVSLNNSVNTEGEQLQGQYKLTIKHKGAQGRYEEICVLVISTLDSGNNPIEISSEKFYISSEIPCNVTVTSGEGGTAESDKAQVMSNEQVTLTATPQEGYSFVNWTVEGKEVSTQNPYTTTITEDIEIKANFITHKITVIASEGGTAKSNKTQVGHNGQVTLTATPNEGYGFVNWTVNGVEVSTKNPYTATITEDIEIKANFITHKITVIASEGGTAKTSKTQVGHNGQVTLTATPNEGYSFVSWTVEGVEVSKENPYTTKITEDLEIKANFKETKGVENGYTWIDLGLPSGLKWATCNVGATTPEEYGDYFAWGETTPKTTYNWSTYKYCNGTWNTMTKYCTNSYYGTVDNKTTLELTDDAAHVNWGGSWRMPTLAEQEELMDTNNCTWTWTTQNGVNGYKVTSKKNGNSIFLPAAGYRYNSDLSLAGSYSGYWSSSLGTSLSDCAYSLYFDSSDVDWGSSSRYYGHSVRPVCE